MDSGLWIIDSKSGAFVLLDPDTGDFMLSGMPTFHENLTGKIMERLCQTIALQVEMISLNLK